MATSVCGIKVSIALVQAITSCSKDKSNHLDTASPPEPVTIILTLLFPINS